MFITKPESGQVISSGSLPCTSSSFSVFVLCRFQRCVASTSLREVLPNIPVSSAFEEPFSQSDVLKESDQPFILLIFLSKREDSPFCAAAHHDIDAGNEGIDSFSIIHDGVRSFDSLTISETSGAMRASWRSRSKLEPQCWHSTSCQVLTERDFYRHDWGGHQWSTRTASGSGIRAMFSPEGINNLRAS